jgi:translocation and assembly module TamA
MKLIAFFLTFSFIWKVSALAETNKICGNILAMDGKLKLNENEKVLICGSQKDSEAWNEIPLSQSKYHLRTILQNLGYSEPRFEGSSDGQLFVWLGPVTKIKSLQVSDQTGILNPKKKRQVKNDPLTSVKLNEIEAWAKIQTQSSGYACSENSVTAQVWDKTVYIDTQLNGRKKFGKLHFSQMSGLDSDVLDRYQPFQEGDWFDIRKTQIMTSRILSDGLFQSAYFVINCHDDVADIKLETSIGKSKVLRFSIGGSTEELPFADLTFKDSRLDDKASSYTASTHASPKEVSLTGSSELYFFPGWNKTFLGPRFRLAKKIENSSETNTAQAGIDIGRNWDFSNIRFNARWGPTLNYTKTIRGVGPAEVTYPTIDSSVTLNSHIYEYLYREQYEGWIFHFNYRGQNKGIGSKLDMNRYRTDLKTLWNLGGFSPPEWILAFRIESIIVDAKDINRNKNRDLLPIDDRIFLGGDENLRGFPRQSLDNNDLGYLTSLYLGFELRLIEDLPYHLQPFLLLDLARAGSSRYVLDKPVFESEGLGLRWPSPFGTLRGSLAKGSIRNKDSSTKSYLESWVLFLSFGQEF